MPQENLKRCPFCGGAPVKGYNSGAVTHIYCMDCRATTHYQCREQDAVDSWNTRAPQSQSGDRAKALDALDDLVNIVLVFTDASEDALCDQAQELAKTIRAALTQPEFEVVDVDSVDGVVDKSAIRYIIQQGYMIIRKKGGL